MLCVYGWYGGTHLHAKPCGDQSHQDRQGWNRVSSEVSFSGPHEPKIWWICRSQFGSLQSEFVKRWSKPTCLKPYYFLGGHTSIRCKKTECRYPQSNPSVADGTKCEHDSKEGLRRDKETLTSICCGWKLYSSFEPISCRLWRASQSSSKWFYQYRLFHHTIFSVFFCAFCSFVETLEVRNQARTSVLN